MRGRSLVDIISDDMQPADADMLNDILDEDPELMARELEITYGGSEPRGPLGGFDELDSLDVMPENSREQNGGRWPETAVQSRLPESGRAGAGGRDATLPSLRCGLRRARALVERSLEVQTVPIGPIGQASGERRGDRYC